MSLPGFTAEASLYKNEERSYRVPQPALAQAGQAVTPTSIFTDFWDWLKGGVPPSNEQPIACGTETKCYGVSLWCLDWCEYYDAQNFPNTKRVEGDWHPCGACLGLPF